MLEHGFEVRFRVVEDIATGRPKVAMHVKKRRSDSRSWDDVETVYFTGSPHPHASVLMSDYGDHPGYIEWCVLRIIENGDMSMPTIAAAREAGAIE